MLAITPIYAGLAALLFTVLSLRVSLARISAKTALGDAGDTVLIRRGRAHGNFCENAPLTLILLVLTELAGAPAIALHAAGLVFLASRLAHAYGISQPNEKMIFRQIGMIGTHGVNVLLALGLIGHALF